jgi:hypothetical protein
MLTIIMQMMAWLAFLSSAITLGLRLRKHPNKKNAEKLSRIVHLAFGSGVMPATGLGVVYPGLTCFDEVIGFRPLPSLSILSIVGYIMLSISVFFIITSYVTIRLSGKGAPAFLLTNRVVQAGLYC